MSNAGDRMDIAEEIIFRTETHIIVFHLHMGHRILWTSLEKQLLFITLNFRENAL